MRCGFAARKRRSRDDRTSLHSLAARNSCSALFGLGNITGIDCVRGVALNGKFQTLKRAAEVVFVEAA